MFTQLKGRGWGKRRREREDRKRKEEEAGTEERPGKSGHGERNKDRREKKEEKVWILIRCMACTWTKISVPVQAIKKGRLPCWSSDHDSTFPMQGAQDGYLIRELDPTCCNWRSLTLQRKWKLPGHNQDPAQPNQSINQSINPSINM